MNCNNFSVSVSRGSETASGYVEIEDNTEYSLILKNYTQDRCIAETSIDGKNIGNFVLEGYSTQVVERPVNESKKFVALFSGTNNFKDADLENVNREDLGLIKVVFKPEVKDVVRPLVSRSWKDSPHLLNCSSKDVGTGLGSDASQQFEEVSGFKTGHPTTIYLRLRQKNGISPLKPSSRTSSPYPKPL